jgi:NADPH2:quinone reductase
MSLPETMRCVEILEPGGPEVLTPAERPLPTPDQNQVLIKVAAAGVNRPDVIQRLGRYPPPPGASDLPGLEVAGEIVVMDDNVSSWSVGDNVCALLTGGGYAEYATADAGSCLSVPDNLSLIEAAALPETAFTVWHNVFQRGQLKSGERILIHGGSSGIGSTAIQLARAHQCEVIVTAGSEEKCAACQELGADLAINYRKEDFVEVVRGQPEKGVDVILDMVGGDYIAKNIKCLRPDGRLVFIAFLGGSKADIDFMSLMLKRLTLTGSTLRTRSDAVKADIASEVRRNVWPWIKKGLYRPRIDRILPLDEAAEAHRIMEKSSHIGKIVLQVS